jgi:hypothetical protein
MIPVFSRKQGDFQEKQGGDLGHKPSERVVHPAHGFSHVTRVVGNQAT